MIRREGGSGTATQCSNKLCAAGCRCRQETSDLMTGNNLQSDASCHLLMDVMQRAGDEARAATSDASAHLIAMQRARRDV